MTSSPSTAPTPPTAMNSPAPLIPPLPTATTPAPTAMTDIQGLFSGSSLPSLHSPKSFPDLKLCLPRMSFEEYPVSSPSPVSPWIYNTPAFLLRTPSPLNWDEDKTTPPPPMPEIVLSPLSGVFYHTDAGAPTYAAFSPEHRPLPAPSLSFLPELVKVEASTAGLLCCRGHQTRHFYICNPLTTQWAKLPAPSKRNYHSIVVVVDSFAPDVYHLVCTYPIVEGRAEFYGVETFDSRRWSWKDSHVCIDREIIRCSGVAAGGAANWRSDDGEVVSYLVDRDKVRVIDPPEGSVSWELGETNGILCCISRSGTAARVWVLSDDRCWKEEGSLDVSMDQQVLKKEGLPSLIRVQGGSCRLFGEGLTSSSGDLLIVVRDMPTGRSTMLKASDGMLHRRLVELVPYTGSNISIKSPQQGNESGCFTDTRASNGMKETAVVKLLTTGEEYPSVERPRFSQPTFELEASPPPPPEPPTNTINRVMKDLVGSQSIEETLRRLTVMKLQFPDDCKTESFMTSAVGLVRPLIEDELDIWDPFEDPGIGMNVMLRWKDVLGDLRYNELWHEVIFPKVNLTGNYWICNRSEEVVRGLSLWGKNQCAPDSFFVRIVEEVVLPNIEAYVETWQYDTFIFRDVFAPWLKALGTKLNRFGPILEKKTKEYINRMGGPDNVKNDATLKKMQILIKHVRLAGGV